MATATFRFSNKKTMKWLKKMAISVKSIRTLKKSYADMVSAFVFQDIMDHFEKEMGSQEKWERWSDAYDEHMIKIGKGANNILQDTGRLRNSFVPTNWRREGAKIVWFNNAKTSDGFPYAAAHDRGRGKLPKRDFMWLSKNAKSDISKATLDFIEKGKK